MARACPSPGRLRPSATVPSSPSREAPARGATYFPPIQKRERISAPSFVRRTWCTRWPQSSGTRDNLAMPQSRWLRQDRGCHRRIPACGDGQSGWRARRAHCRRTRRRTMYPRYTCRGRSTTVRGASIPFRVQVGSGIPQLVHRGVVPSLRPCRDSLPAPAPLLRWRCGWSSNALSGSPLRPGTVKIGSVPRVTVGARAARTCPKPRRYAIRQAWAHPDLRQSIADQRQRMKHAAGWEQHTPKRVGPARRRAHRGRGRGADDHTRDRDPGQR